MKGEVGRITEAVDSALDIPGLLALLDGPDTVVLPTPRAATALRERFNRRQATRGLRAWEPASVLTWDQCTTSLWSALLLAGADDRILLNPLQEQALWTQVIAASTEGGALSAGPLQQMAALAASALSLAAAHLPADQLLRSLQSSADSFDSRHFADWCSTFLARCEAERLLPRALLASALKQHAKEHRLPLSAPVHCVGFERLTPAQTALLNALQTAGHPVLTHSLHRPPAHEAVRAAVQSASPEQELRWAARWIRTWSSQQKRPDLSIALILPDPAADRPALEPILREILAPELERIDADLSSTPWHFNTGLPLANLPILRDALSVLRWTRADLHIEDAGRLLLSPFFGCSDPLESRARFERRTLRGGPLLRPELSLDRLLSLAREHNSPGQPGIQLNELHSLRQLVAAPGQLSGTGSHADWTELVRRMLRALRWPGDRALSPAEFRATEAWETLLDSLATLDLLGRRPTFDAFLQTLEREAQSMKAPEPTDSAMIQVARLDHLEGCLFDAVLALHSTDQVLPAPERTHPLLGWGLQQRLRLPGTDPGLTHARSLDALRSLSHRSGDLLIVAPAADENGPLRLTPLAAELNLPILAAEALLPPQSPAPPLVSEPFEDTEPLPPLPQAHVPGGARVLELQAACGFRAFASLRLRAEAPDSRNLGLDPRESGKVLHRAMELLWSELKSRESLDRLPEEQRRSLVRSCVESAFGRLRTRLRNSGAWPTAYLDVLQDRLTSLISRWLRFELDRGHFTVLAPEQKQTVNVGPLELSVRLDRVDKVESGYVFIDYKTALDLKTSHWLGDRPDLPQLPLYTLLAEPREVRGVAFARLRPGDDMAWISLHDQPGIFPAKKRERFHDLEAEMAAWRAELDRLAHAFAAGDAQVDPKQYPRTCLHCDQRLLCRVNPSALISGADLAPDPEVHVG